MNKSISAVALTILLALIACGKGSDQTTSEETVGQQDKPEEIVEEVDENRQDIDDEAADEFMKIWGEMFTPCNWQIGDSTETIWTGVFSPDSCRIGLFETEAYQVLYVETLGISDIPLTAADKANGYVLHYIVGPLDPAFRAGELSLTEDGSVEQSISEIAWEEWKSDSWNPRYDPSHCFFVTLYLTHDGEWIAELPRCFSVDWAECSLPPEEIWPEFTCDDIQQ